MRFVLLSLVSLAIPNVTSADVPRGTTLEYVGSGINNTYGYPWKATMSLSIDELGKIVGYHDTDGFPGGQTMCGQGELRGSLDGNTISYSFPTSDNDYPACNSTYPNSRTNMTGSISLNGGVVNVSYVVDGTPVGVLINQMGTARYELKSNIDRFVNTAPWLDRVVAAERAGLPEAAYRRQYYCLAEKSRQEWRNNGTTGWASGFVKHVFEVPVKADGVPLTLNRDCKVQSNSGAEFTSLETLDPAACIQFPIGVEHGIIELAPAFASYCSKVSDNADFDRWESDHEAFLEHAVAPCFQELAVSGHISSEDSETLTRNVRAQARLLRSASINMCKYSKDGLRKSTNLDIENYKIIRVDPDAYLDLYSDVLEEHGRLQVGLDYQDFSAINVNSQAQITVTKSMPDGSEINLTGNDKLEYGLDRISQQYATVDSNGVLSIASKPFPTEEVVFRMSVLVTTSSDTGIGQYIIQDYDADLDGLVDSYEIGTGLNELQASDSSADHDSDMLTSVTEALIGTDPFSIDSDGDQYPDGYEYYTGSNPLDPECNPIEPCTNSASLFEDSETEDNDNSFAEGSSGGGGVGGTTLLSLIVWMVCRIRRRLCI